MCSPHTKDRRWQMKDNGLRKMNLQFFAEDPSTEESSENTQIENVDQLDSFLDGVGAEETETADVTTEDPEAEVQEEEVEQLPEVQTKANHAFAQMRTQVKTYENLLDKVAQATGIEYQNVEELTTKLNDDALAKLAAKQNVPVELLQKLEKLEADSNNWKQAQLKDAALIGFQNLMTEFDLTQEELNAFAIELDESDKNPFTTAVDVKAEYISRHYNDVLQKRVQKEVQEALKKSSVADQHSTTPNNKSGGQTSTEGKVTTVAGLNQFLNGLEKTN